MDTARPLSYLFALVDGGGTVPPELGAARWLVERGHHVDVLADDSMNDEVHAVGAIFGRGSRRSIGPAEALSMTHLRTGSAERRCSCSPVWSIAC